MEWIHFGVNEHEKGRLRKKKFQAQKNSTVKINDLQCSRIVCDTYNKNMKSCCSIRVVE
jgi:hypothetical protein